MLMERRGNCSTEWTSTRRCSTPSLDVLFQDRDLFGDRFFCLDVLSLFDPAASPTARNSLSLDGPAVLWKRSSSSSSPCAQAHGLSARSSLSFDSPAVQWKRSRCPPASSSFRPARRRSLSTALTSSGSASLSHHAPRPAPASFANAAACDRGGAEVSEKVRFLREALRSRRGKKTGLFNVVFAGTSSFTLLAFCWWCSVLAVSSARRPVLFLALCSGGVSC